MDGRLEYLFRKILVLARSPAIWVASWLLVRVSESPETLVRPAASGEGIVRVDGYVAPRTKHGSAASAAIHQLLG